MKRILLILVLFSTTIALSQEKTFESEVQKISRNIDRITKQQKDSLKLKVSEINKRLEKGLISAETAKTLKQESASYHAKRIETLVSLEQLKLQQLVQDKTDGKIFSLDKEWQDKNYSTALGVNVFNVGDKTYRLGLVTEDWRMPSTEKVRQGWRRRRTSEFVFAMGVNNVLDGGQLSSLDNSPYQFWRSRFYELGLAWTYRLRKEPSHFYFRYGFSFLWNNLRPDNQQYHVLNGTQTEIADFPNTTGQLGDARLRHVQLIFPMHLEIDLSKKFTRDGEVFDRRHNSWRLGLGGFVGFKLGTRQYLEYRDPSGIKVEQVQRNNFNMNQYNYGLSAYLAHRTVGLYVKYDLNPLFKDTEIRNLSMGLRFDFD